MSSLSLSIDSTKVVPTVEISLSASSPYDSKVCVTSDDDFEISESNSFIIPSCAANYESILLSISL